MSLKDFLKTRLSAAQQNQLRDLVTRLRTIGYWDSLNKLAAIYKTDKWGLHFYTPHYSEHFKKLRYKKIKLLEIGVGGYDNPKLGGESLRMWKKYFPFGTIYSIDIFDKSFHEEDRIKIFKGSQVDEEFLQELVNVTGPLDIIIDDGSHINEHAIKSFKILFPSLKIGGMYVIEDTQTSYWPDYGGNSDDLHHGDTMLNFCKQLTDCLNHKEFIRQGYIPDYFDRHIVDMHFYHNMVFIHKDKNEEESNFLKNNILP